MSEDALAPALDFSQDTDVVPRRRARKVIYSPSDLTAAEKTALLDLVQAGVDVRAGERVAVTRADFDNLMSLVFSNDWNTSIEISNLADFPPRGFEGETIQVGTFSRTQHEPRSAEETPLERREGAPVFISNLDSHDKISGFPSSMLPRRRLANATLTCALGQH